MAIIKKLTIKQNSGLLSELQSDTIWGHFCWRLLDKLGMDLLKTFLNEYINGNPVFTISNSYFERDDNLFFNAPVNLENTSSIKNNSKQQRIISFQDYKKRKERKLINLKELNSFLKGDQLPSYRQDEDIEEPAYMDSLRTSVEISRATLSSMRSQLFTYNVKYVNEVYQSDNNELTSTNNVVFLKILNEKLFGEINGEDLMYDTFEVGYGKKKSSGFGAFKIAAPLTLFNDFEEPENGTGFVTLSNYLPSSNDGLTDLNYKLIVKYGKLGEHLSLSANPFKRPIVMMMPGSVFVSDRKSDFYGRSTSVGELSDSFPDAIQNGYAFSLRANV